MSRIGKSSDTPRLIRLQMEKQEELHAVLKSAKNSRMCQTGSDWAVGPSAIGRWAPQELQKVGPLDQVILYFILPRNFFVEKNKTLWSFKRKYYVSKRLKVPIQKVFLS